MGWLWSLMNFVGPFLLLGVIVWATVYTRRGRRAEREREEHRRKEAQSETHTFESE